MAKRAPKPIHKQQEDWDADLVNMPPHQSCVSGQEASEPAQNPNTWVFYNQRLSNAVQCDTFPKKDGRESKEIPVKSSSSYSSDGIKRDSNGNFGKKFNYHRDSAGSVAASQEFNRGCYRGRGRGTLRKDKDIPLSYGLKSEGSRQSKEHKEDLEECRSVELKHRKNRQSQFRQSQSHKREPENRRVPKEVTSLEVPDSLSTRSEKKDSEVRKPVKDEDDFPALSRAIGLSQPNYWADRHAFVKGARPKTADEEAEMLRLAMEASQLEEAERQQKILEEENQYKTLLLESSQSSTLFEGLSLNDIEEPMLFPVELQYGSELINETSKVHPRVFSAENETSLITQPPVGQPSCKESCITSVSNGSSQPSFTCNSGGNLSTSVPKSTQHDTRFSQSAFSFNRDSRLDRDESLASFSDARYEEEEFHQSPPEVIYQNVSVGQKLDESCAPDVVYQTTLGSDGSVLSTSPKVSSPTSVADRVTMETGEKQLVSDTVRGGQYLEECDSSDFHSSGNVFNRPVQYTTSNNIPTHLDDVPPVSYPYIKLCDIPVTGTSPNTLYASANGCMPVSLSGSVPNYPVSSYPAGQPRYPVMPAQAFNAMGQMAFLPGYACFQNGMPALPPWPYCYQSMMMPSPSLPPGLVPPAGMVPLPMGYPAMTASPHAWFPQGLRYPFIPGASVSPFLSMPTMSGESSPDQKNLDLN